MSDHTLPTDHYVDPYAVEHDAEHTSSANRWRILSPFNLIVVAGTLLLIGVVLFGIYENQRGTVTVGEDAPDFTLTTYDGEEFQLADYEGNKVVVINFWHTQCPPCHTEAEALQRVYASYQDNGVIFIGVNVKDPDRVAFEFMEQYGITYPNGLDRADVINRDLYRTTGWPETFIVDRNGVITLHQAGAISEGALRAAIDDALERA